MIFGLRRARKRLDAHAQPTFCYYFDKPRVDDTILALLSAIAASILLLYANDYAYIHAYLYHWLFRFGRNS